MAETIRGINVVIGSDTTGLSKALGDVNKNARDIQSELKQVDRLLKFDPSNTELVAQKQKLLADAVANTQEKLDRLKSVQEQVNEQFAKGEISEGQYRAYQREVTKTEQDLQKLESQIKDMQPAVESLGDKMEKAGEKMKSVGDKMTGVGKTMSLGVTAPIVAIGTASAKAAIDFESAFAGVRKTVDATEEEFVQLEQGIRDMSKQMPASAADIAAVAEAAGQLGIETPNILKFTETMIGLGEATNLSAEEAATQFARFANIVGMSQGDFDKLGSTVVALGNNFATTEAEIVALSLRLAAQGKQVGMTEAEITALAATMSSLGVEAEAGGTAMTSTLKKIQTAVAEGGKGLDAFADVARMSSEDFAAAFQQRPIEALDAFVKGLALTSAEGGNLTTVLGDLGISGIRESDTLLRMAGASDLLSEAVATSAGAWEDNLALTNEVEQRYATTESQLAILKNSIIDLGIQIGEIIVPALMTLVEAVRPVIEWFGNLDESTQRTIVIIAGLAAAIGPVILIAGKLVSSIGAILPVLAALTNPIALVVAAIAGLVAGLVILYNKNETVRKALDTAWNAIKKVAETVFGAIQDFWDKWGDTITETFKNVVEVVRTIFEKAFNIIKKAVEVVFNGLKAFWDTWGGTIKTVFQSTLNVVKSIFEGIWNAIKIVIETVIGVISNVIKAFLAVLKGDWKGAWDAVKGVAESIWNGIKNMFSNVKNTMMDVGKNIIKGMIDGIKSMANAAVETAKNVAKQVGDSVKNFFGISSPSKLMRGYGEDIGEGLALGIKASVSDVKHQVDELNTVATPSLAGTGVTGVGSVVAGGVINMEGLFAGATISVRSDNDIRAIAREIWSLGQQAQRGGGGVR